MPEADLVTHIKRVIAEEKEVCPPQKLHFCTWINGLYKFEPMPKQLIKKVVKTITDEGVYDITLYGYKVHDWRVGGPGRGRQGQPSAPKDPFHQIQPEDGRGR